MRVRMDQFLGFAGLVVMLLVARGGACNQARR